MSDSIRFPIPKVPFNPPVYMIRRAEGSPVIDGNLDKPFWNKAGWTDLFTDIEGPSLPAPRFETKAKMLWDDDNLYIGAILYGNEIWACQYEHDCVIFKDNDFEIFIDPDSDTQEYVEYEMNVNNANWDLLLTKAYRDNGSPINGLELKGLKSAVKVCGEINNPHADNKYWSVEIVIPFTTLNECSSLRRTPLPGEYYRMNFSRVQWKTDIVNNHYEKRLDPDTGNTLPEDNWVWAPTGVINIHYPDMWAFAFFCKENESYDIPVCEFKKWSLRKLYYAEKIYYDLTGAYTNDIGKLKEILNSRSPIPENGFADTDNVTIETTAHTYEITLEDESGSFSLLSDGKIISY